MPRTHAKTLAELVLGRTFRQDRHRDLLRYDMSIHHALELVDAGKLELRADQEIRLYWLWWWQAQYFKRLCMPDIALRGFVDAMNDQHPAGWPPAPEGDS